MQANTIPLVEDIPFDVSPSTRSLLVEILSQLATVKDEVAELREENRQLREEVDALKDNLRTLGVWTAPQKVEDLWEWVEDLDKTRTKTRTSTANAATEERQNHVKALLLKAEHHRLTIKDIAPRLGVTRQQTWNIVRDMERARVVNIINDPHHRQRKIIELHQQIGTFSNY